MPLTVENPSRTPLDTDRLMKHLFAIAIAATVVGVTVNAYVAFPPGLPRPGIVRLVADLLYPNTEGNLYVWFSVLVLASIGALFLVAALPTEVPRQHRRAYLAVGAVALYLSADEAAALHERLGVLAAALSLGSRYTYQWVILAVPLVLVVGVALLWIARTLDKRLRNRLIIAGGVFLVGAIGFETLGAMTLKLDIEWSVATEFLIHELTVMLEEGCEIVGSLLAVRAILLHLRLEHFGGEVVIDTRR